jgi:predicted kinase
MLDEMLYILRKITALEHTWELLQNHVSTLHEMRLQQVEICCFDSGLCRPEYRARLQELLKLTDTWGYILRFDHQLQYLPAAPAFS